MIFKDLESLSEAYALIVTEAKKKPDKDGDHVPDWADKHPGKDDKKEKTKEAPSKAKKKLPFMKGESLTFSTLFKSIMSEEKKISFGPSPISGPFEHDKTVWMLRRLSNGEISHINEEEQYLVTWKNPEKHNGQKEQPLKGESVLSFIEDVESIRRAFPEQA